MSVRTVFDVLDDYLLTRDTRASTDAYYRRVLGVFCSWAGRVVLADEFDCTLVNRFLRDKQAQGRTSYYRRSLRSGLRSLLRFSGHQERLRPVKPDVLLPLTWSADELRLLLAEVAKLPDVRRQWWRTLILAGWFTGLSQVDLFRLERSHVSPAGVVRMKRSKTGRPVVVWMPSLLVAEIAAMRPSGVIWPLRYSPEMFRRDFRRLVLAAGLRGSFKTLRNSSGTAVEELHPGRGHEHLGNGRAIFERHYWGRQDEREPLRLPDDLAV